MVKRTARRRRVMPEVEVKLAKVKCAFCKGTGRDPFPVLSHLSNCPVCGGRKTVTVREPYETCKACEGTGLYFNSRMYCWPCRGKGVVPVKEAPQPSTTSEE